MRLFIIYLLLSALSLNSLAQLTALTQVQKNRALAKYYEKEEKFDSMRLTMDRYITNEKYTNPGDYLLYAFCSLKTKDTTDFINYLSKGIRAGFEAGSIHGYARALKGDDLVFLNDYLDNHYKRILEEGYATYDTTMIKEVKLIMEMDQLVHSGWKNDSNIKYRSFLSKQIDSINYERVRKLFEDGKYPGYHNCGVYTSGIVIIMMHITDSHEDRFQYIFKKIKAAELEGNISPDEIATVADRHYTGTLTTPRSYYGHWKGRTADLYDCAQVDKFRAEIGLDDLGTEYRRAHRAVPTCYGK